MDEPLLGETKERFMFRFELWKNRHKNLYILAVSLTFLAGVSCLGGMVLLLSINQDICAYLLAGLGGLILYMFYVGELESLNFHITCSPEEYFKLYGQLDPLAKIKCKTEKSKNQN
jgi:hypothetical protein